MDIATIVLAANELIISRTRLIRGERAQTSASNRGSPAGNDSCCGSLFRADRLSRKSWAVLDGLKRVVKCRATLKSTERQHAAPAGAVIVITPWARYLTARHMMVAKQRM
jgi:hypothetical protein